MLFLWWHPKLSHVYDTTIKETNIHSCGQIQFRGRALFPSRWHPTFICFVFSTSRDGNGNYLFAFSLFPRCRIHPLRIPKVIAFFPFPPFFLPILFSCLISAFGECVSGWFGWIVVTWSFFFRGVYSPFCLRFLLLFWDF